MNIYKEHYDEVRSFEGDMGCSLTSTTLHTVSSMTHWRSVQTGVPELLSVEDKQLLGL